MAVAAVSRAVMRRDNRLDVLALIAARAPEPVFARALALRLGIADNQVGPELAMLRDVGALAAIDLDGTRHRYHQPLAHPIWAFAAALVTHTIAREVPDDPRGAVLAYIRDRYGCDTTPEAFAAELREQSFTG